MGKKQTPEPLFDLSLWTPVLRCSICTGEQTACFRENATGKLREVMLIRNEQDLEEFRRKYTVTGEIEKIY
ncbi:MAG: aspartate dehydrogenase [Lachnospiraceae bacterium]|nr:aspartate dehydrogenase [Lachnospiraceae bacterium]